jgi:pyruvate dehydrogenase E2 component (dihydrolipoamide acetyltransferase)
MTDVVMPQMGESIVEGTLTKWLKKPGERVERDEPLFEISTDKVDTEIPSPSAGTLNEILVEEGATVQINTVVARIADGAGGQAAPAASRSAGRTAEAAAPPPTVQPAATAPLENGVAPESVSAPAGPISPLVRRMARENNIDLNQVTGTGAGGRITKQDVEAYLAQRTQPVAPAAAPTHEPPAPLSQTRPVSQAAAPAMPLPAPTAAKTRVEPLSTMRQRIAEHMVLSKRTSPHVTTVHRVVVGLRQYPLLNASIDGTNIIYHNEINIGIAVALENGLIVPVIRGADERNVLGLQHAIFDLATRARARQLKPDEVQAGTFSITNFGSFGSVMGTPIINQPQVAILGVGTVDKTPVVIDDAIAIRSMCYLSLSFDHRLVDGALADQFMTRVKQVLEDWSEDVL